MSFLDTFTGAAGAEAAQQAAAIQGAATPIAMGFINNATAQGRADLEPFKQAGVNSLAPLQGLVNDPNQQKDFITNNPFYKALADDAQSRLFANQAARGKVGSGETAKALQNSMLLLGQDLVNNNVNQNQNIANMGLGAAGTRAAASQYAGRSLSELATGDANARAAGVVGAANAQAAGSENILGSGLSLASLLSGGKGVDGIGSSLASLGGGIKSLLGMGGDSAAQGAANAAAMNPAGGTAATTYGAPSPSGGGFTNVPSPSSVIGGAAFDGFSGLAGLGSGIGTGAVPGATLNAGVANAGFSGFSGLSGLGSGVGSGSAGAAPTIGAAAGGEAAAGGSLLSGGAGAMLGAALPAAIFGFGMSQSNARRARDIEGFKPTIAAARSAPVQTINGVTGPMFFGPSGQAAGYFIASDPNQIIDGSAAIRDVYSVNTGEWGSLEQGGFVSDRVEAESAASRENDSGDDYQGPPVKVVVDNSGPRPAYSIVSGDSTVPALPSFASTGLPPDQHGEYQRGLYELVNGQWVRKPRQYDDDYN